ncbi:protein phosphatase 2C 50-like isoform X1 [Primulina eburnea]|uniref:protein phosphatase 2C 50-like isoform X1 n=2 Tax=Primulina eburnea TaxID=1245227 RepID=UPI003C6BE7E1
MDEITPVISVSFKLGNLINEDSVLTTCVDITGIELISKSSRSLLLEPSMAKLPMSIENISFTSSVPLDGVVTKNESNFDEPSIDVADLSAINREDEGSVVLSDPINQELRKGGFIPFDIDSIPGIIDCGYESNGTITPCVDECKVLEVDLGPIALSFLNKDCNGSYSINSSDSGESLVESFAVEDLVLVGKNGEAMVMLDLSKRISESLFEVSKETKINKLNFPPVWGLVSIQGRRSEMEDSAVALPRFLRLPSQMLSDNPQLCSSDQDSTVHLFGVYDGHGGSQVANYCKERLHIALTEEIDKSKQNFNYNYVGYSWKEQWMKIFLNCFQKIDDEVGGSPEIEGDITSDSLVVPPIAPDSVGSTAVVAIVSSTQIIVANCGDSRAVLCRGKVAVPLSTDHKPHREDEYERIEALGGKVINWNGYRVSGVLAVSRSIGDRYLSPYIIADPDITFHPRAKEDECLILASDGLWDVMTNEEACDLARRRILLWHKRNGGTISKDRGEDADPAAQDAANYLSQVAFQRGSIDNISVVVVDLKAPRKVKKKV